MKKLLAILTVLALLAPAALAEIRHESEGYDSPEAAVEAYVEALNRGDADDMLSAFALETFVDHCDAETAMQRLQSISPGVLITVPVNGAYSRSLLINARRAQITNSLVQQYIQISAQLANTTVPLQDAAARQEMLDRFANSPANAWEGNVTLVGWVNPALLSETIAYPMNMVSAMLQSAYYDPDDLAWEVARINVAGEDAVLLVQCAKYGDRWYIAELGGIPGMVLGIPTTAAGMIFASDPDMGGMIGVLSRPLAVLDALDAARLLDANAASDLPGTRWVLTGIGGADGATVCDEPDESAQASGLAAWGELKFMRVGALAALRVSPAASQALGADEQRLYLGLAWTDMNGSLELLEMRGMGIRPDPEGNGIALDGDTLTLNLSNGMALIFEKAN